MKIYKNKYIHNILFTLAFTLILIFTYVDKSYCDNENDQTMIEEVYKYKDENPKEISEQYTLLLENLFDYRNKAILEKNEEILKKLYDTDINFGLWAYEHEVMKMKYLENWSSKQGVKFNDIKTKVKLKKIREREENLYGIICDVSTEYKYTYENDPEKENVFRIGKIRRAHV